MAPLKARLHAGTAGETRRRWDAGLKLVIVESPAKARTLSKILGRGYAVRASMGHVRDLPVSEFGVDLQHGFRPRYVVVRGKARTVKELQEQAEQAEQVLLATDPDREGEAISWHLAQLLDVPEDAPCRIEFHEVTARAVQQALRRPRPIDRRLVEAQQARRILDRIVGYRLSPLLWKKVRRGLSAGRVQSVALRLVCEREEEIEAFVPREYWTVDVRLAPLAQDGAATNSFVARLVRIDGQEADIPHREAAEAIEAELRGLTFSVASVQAQRRQRGGPPPFTTSTLQQEASRRLGFTARRTMALAQQLYEGLELGGGLSTGLITYMRTDSVRVAPEALEEVRAFIRREFGPEDLPETPVVHKSKKGAQEAHEAIRPTSVERTPESVKAYLTRDQYRLYELIWRRFVASQMAPAVIHTVTVRIEAGRFELRASGSTVEKPGFLQLWPPGKPAGRPDGSGSASEAVEQPPAKPAVSARGGKAADGSAAAGAAAPGEDEQAQHVDQNLPTVAEGDRLHLIDVQAGQHFTQPPPRFNDASLVKAMEELGIGRPSTYAPTIETLLERRYCQRQGRQLVPTPLGRAVVRLLKEHFPDIMDVEFTARLESELDDVEAGKALWNQVLARFYPPFEQRVQQVMARVQRVSVQEETTAERCERCGRPMAIKWGRYGQFLACTGYPECKATRPLLKTVDAHCPRCGANLVQRRTRKGRSFYGCARYPECDFVLWHQPVGRDCPRCGRPLVVRRSRRGEQVVCSGSLKRGVPGDDEGPCDYVETGEPQAAPLPVSGPGRDAPGGS